ncbi:hypothetical protein GCM10009588_04070 [Microbacterium phyllosphaerae]
MSVRIDITSTLVSVSCATAPVPRRVKAVLSDRGYGDPNWIYAPSLWVKIS